MIIVASHRRTRDPDLGRNSARRYPSRALPPADAAACSVGAEAFRAESTVLDPDVGGRYPLGLDKDASYGETTGSSGKNGDFEPGKNLTLREVLKSVGA